MAMRDTMHGSGSGMARMHPPFALPGASRVPRQAETGVELPSIQDFLDELPSIDDYVWAGDSKADDMRSIDDYLEDASVEAAENFGARATASGFDDDGWAIADWQSFDWNGAAMLGSRAEEPAASGAPTGAGRNTGQAAGKRSHPLEITPSAEEVARALDGIAQRIRSGELKIDQLTGSPPEAAMAAALAALLRMRD